MIYLKHINIGIGIGIRHSATRQPKSKRWRVIQDCPLGRLGGRHHWDLGFWGRTPA